jgi:NitT/TauT family transport system ATP-binding protein
MTGMPVQSQLIDRISIKNLSFSFGGTGKSPPVEEGRRRAVDRGPKGLSFPVFQNLSLTLGAENPVVILGPSGCGKTTLLRLMAGLLEPDAVEVPAVTEAGTAAAGTFPLPGAFVFQDPRLLPWLTVLGNIILPLKRKMDKQEARDRALHFLELVSLGEKAAAYPGELSGGQRQRVSIARAFAYPARSLFMDEPFQSLDIPLRIELMDLTRSLFEREPRLVIAVTHDPREAVYLGRRIIILGKAPEGIVFDEPVELSREERAFGAEAHSRLEAQLLSVLAG